MRDVELQRDLQQAILLSTGGQDAAAKTDANNRSHGLDLEIEGEEHVSAMPDGRVSETSSEDNVRGWRVIPESNGPRSDVRGEPADRPERCVLTNAPLPMA
eukprot:1306867-Rhodomonas_salina.1